MTSEAAKEEAFQKFYQEENGSLHYMNSIKQREGMTPVEIAGTFDKWVEKGTYKSDTDALSYIGPILTAEKVAEIYQAGRENIKLLDVAAGTGLLSVELRKYGFSKIDGVDPSSISQSAAMEAGLYDRYLVDFVNEKRLDINTDEYDCAVSSGGFAPGLMPCVALRELIRIVKPGGIVCFSVPSYIITLVEEYVDKFEPLMEKYVSQGFWEKISRTRVDGYLDQRPGIIYVFKVLTSEVS